MGVLPDQRRAAVKRYFTTFPLTENPINESGAWISGGTVGLDWGDIRTGASPNAATCATDTFTFNDCHAILTDPGWAFSPDVYARAQVRTVSQIPANFQEVELMFRRALSAHSSTGYEVFWKCANDGSQYVAIARWDGPEGSFTTPHNHLATGPGLTDGDYIEAYIRGSLVTAYVNGVLQFTFDVATGFNGADFYVGGVLQGSTSSNGTYYATGAPGIGMDEGASGGSTLTTWGLYNYFVENL
jgi:hypothetical protein